MQCAGDLLRLTPANKFVTGKILNSDLEHVFRETDILWEELRGQRIFISGGTGFFGCWLLESFARINARLNLGATAVVLTRNPAAFQRKAPHLAACPSIQLYSGDIRSFDFPSGSFRFVIHAATDATEKAVIESPLETLDTIVGGTRHILDFARNCGAQGFLFTSSGAVYGKQPPEVARLSETFRGAPDPADPASSYGESKRLAETLCCIYAAKYGFACRIARCFAFAGPYLPLDGHFAIGNFVCDAIRGEPIRIHGDGTPVRSYLYAADLAVWLWTILFRGENCQPYNVGSEREVSISELATAVVDALSPGLPVETAHRPVPGTLPLRYLPSTALAQNQLGLSEHFTLKEMITRMARWHEPSLQEEMKR